jgi:hypothetical protein
MSACSTNADWRPNSDIWIAILALFMIASGRETTSSWRLKSIFPYTELGKNLKLIDHRWTSGRAAERSGRMQARTEAFRQSVGSGRKTYVVRTDDAGLSGVRSWWTCRPDGWNSWQMGVQTRWHVARTADRESEIFYLLRYAESSEIFMSSGIPVYNIFTHKWFCPNTEWGQNTNTRHKANVAHKQWIYT